MLEKKVTKRCSCSPGELRLLFRPSAQVYSGYRFLLGASDRKIPIGILNIGPTRADHLAELKVSGRCGEVLSAIRPV